MSDVQNALENLLQSFLEQGQGTLPKTEYDQDWQSPCQEGEVDDQGMIAWKPVLRAEAGQFENVEQALGVELHRDIKDFYGCYFSEAVDAEADNGGLQLLFAWSEQDFERLQQNIIGHVLMKQKLKQPVTVFFAVTDEEDWFLSLDNNTGQILLETPGLIPEKVVAESMTAFLGSIRAIFPQAD